MKEELKVRLNSDSLATLLRTNLACHHGKVITQELSNEITVQIIESIDYFLNKKDD